MRYFLLLPFIFFVNNSLARDGDLKQLHALLKEYNKGTHDNKETLNTILQIVHWHVEAMQFVKFPKSKDSVFYYGNKAVNLSYKLQDEIGLGKVYLLYSQCYIYKNDAEKMRKYASDALILFQRKNYTRGIADASSKVALSYYYSSNTASADDLNNAQKAKELYTKLNDKIQIAVTDKIISQIYDKRGEYEKALEYARKSVRLFVKEGYYQKEYVGTLLNIGVLHHQAGNIDEALKVNLEAVKVAERLDPEAHITAFAYENLASKYNAMGKSQESLTYLKKADNIARLYTDEHFWVINSSNLLQVLMDMGKHREAITYLKKMEEYKDLDMQARITVLKRLISTYIILKYPERASKHVNEAITILNSSGEDRTTALLYAPVAMYYFAIGQYEYSRAYLKKYITWSGKSKSKYMLDDIYYNLFKIDSVQSNFKSAVINLQLSHRYKDSVFNERSEKRINELNVQYDLSKKTQALALREKDNNLLTQKNQLQHERLQRSNLLRNVSIGGIGILVIFVGLLYNRYSNNKRTNRILRVQQSEIRNSNETLKNLVTEKEWLLKEIHHRVKNNLHIIMSLLNSQSYFLQDKAALTAIQNSQHRIQSMSLIHQKLYMSDNLTAINIATYVNELVEYLSDCFNTQKKVRFYLKLEDVKMDVSQAVPIGLILNEAITNCFKYAFTDGIGNINICLTNTFDDIFCLEITDDGVGFPHDFDIKNVKSLGMKLINGLTRDLDGTLAINSSTEGTHIKIEFIYKQLLFNERL